MATQLDKIAVQERTRREILQQSESLAPLPDVVVRVLGCLNAPDCDAGVIEKEMGCDQVLVGKMLALVNSPFYGLSNPVRSIRDAIMVLGFRGLRSLLLASSVAEHLELDFSIYGHDRRGLFKHSMVVATAAREIGRIQKLGLATCEELFVVGLLHDIGKILLVSHLAESDHDPNVYPSVAAEREKVGIDHCEAGRLIAEKWGLGEFVCSIVEGHHADQLLDHPEMGSAFAAVRIANELSVEHRVGMRDGYQHEPMPFARELEVLGMDAETWAAAQSAIEDAVDRTMSQSDHF